MPSRNLNNGVRKELDRAIHLNRQGDPRAAITLLKDLLKKYATSAAVAGYLAGIYFEQSDMPNAEKYFRQATRLNPKSELASVGLFHSLWNQRRETEATEEMRRFLNLSDSPEYARLLHDLAVEGQLIPQLEPALS